MGEQLLNFKRSIKLKNIKKTVEKQNRTIPTKSVVKNDFQ